VSARRFSARLKSTDELVKHMMFQGYTVTTLFEDVESAVRKHNRKTRDDVRVCRSTIGNLRAGVRNTAPLAVAVAIEDCLKVPRGDLFAPRVSRVPSNTGMREAGMVNLLTVVFGLAFAAAVLIIASFLMADIGAMLAYLEDLGATAGQYVARSLRGVL
jgi:hypothetical protein